MPLGTEVSLGPGHIVLDGDPAPPPKGGGGGGQSPPIFPDQTAIWIKMPLGTELGLGPGNFFGEFRAPDNNRSCSIRSPPMICGAATIYFFGEGEPVHLLKYGPAKTTCLRIPCREVYVLR